MGRRMVRLGGQKDRSKGLAGKVRQSIVVVVERRGCRWDSHELLYREKQQYRTEDWNRRQAIGAMDD